MLHDGYKVQHGGTVNWLQLRTSLLRWELVACWSGSLGQARAALWRTKWRRAALPFQRRAAAGDRLQLPFFVAPLLVRLSAALHAGIAVRRLATQPPPQNPLHTCT